MTQEFWEAHNRIADGNEAMLDLLFGVNPIMDDELRSLIEGDRAVYEPWERQTARPTSGSGE